ncbi:MAG: FAD-dependent oxidoreductase [Vicinamibacterales bacterium]
MVRDLRRLADTSFDLLVIGAGIYGSIAAWDAAARGLTVALIDQGDFGGATSANSLKTLHGGLRSLQAANLRQMRLYIRERRALARIAPHLVRPLRFVVPTYRRPGKSRSLFHVALALNDLIAADRNRGIEDPALRLPRGRVVSRDECLRLNPVIDPQGVTGGATWHDYQMRHGDRLNLAFVQSAVDAGAAVGNHLRAERFLLDGTRVAGASVVDTIGGEAFDIRARAVLNAAGPWAASLLATLPGGERGTPGPRLSRAVNLVVRRVTGEAGCGGLAEGRFLFLVPWRDVSMLGTSHDAYDGSPDRLGVTRWDVEAFLADARLAFPLANLSGADVRLVHRGLLPMVSGEGAHVQLLRESTVIEHRRQGVGGLVSMFGVRYTTARQTAAHAVNAVFRLLGTRVPPACRTAETPVSGGAITNIGAFLRAVELRQIDGVPPETLLRLAAAYGTHYDRILALIRDTPALGRPLGEQCVITGAEVVHAVREEAAHTLADIVLRRTEAGSAGHPGADALATAACLAAPLLGWNAEQAERQIADVERSYRWD